MMERKSDGYMSATTRVDTQPGVKAACIAAIVAFSPLSCAGGPGAEDTHGTIGRSGIVAEDGVVMVRIPPGEYRMGGDGPDDSGPVHAVRVSAFWMDEHEITVGGFKKYCLEAGVDYDMSDLAPCPEEPATVGWESAASYCAHYGKRLPTEAEFEWVLRGGRDGTRYPWGDSALPPEMCGNLPDVSLLREKELQRAAYAREAYLCTYDDGFAGLAPVKSFTPNEFGVFDIAGNAWEWCNDWFDADYYKVSPVVDPTGPSAPGERVVARFASLTYHDIRGPAWRVVRGGGAHALPEQLRCSFRYSPDSYGKAGFRGVITVPRQGK